MKKFLCILCLSVVPLAAFCQGLTPKKAFAQLKKLVGTWEMKNPDGTISKVNYRLTGAGSALFETQFPGEPHEMVSVYHLDGNRLMMTHYCAAGNQPTMVYHPGKDAKILTFDFFRGSNMKLSDMHIHSAKIKFLGPEQLKSEWTGYSKGKNAGTTIFELKRVPEATK